MRLPVRVLGLGLIALFSSVPGACKEQAARAIVEKAAARQGGGDLGSKVPIDDFHIVLDVLKHDTGDEGRGAGTLTRSYKPPAGARRKPLFREKWDDAAGITERGLGHDGEGRYRGWTRKGRRVTVLGPRHRETYLKLKNDAGDMDLLLRSFLVRSLLGDGVTLTLLDEVKVGERAEWRVKREVDGKRPLVLGIDRETHDLMRVIVPATKEAPVERRFRFARHKVFQGVRVPEEIRIFERTEEDRKAGKPGRETTVAFIDALKFNRGLPDSFFDVPK